MGQAQGRVHHCGGAEDVGFKEGGHCPQDKDAKKARVVQENKYFHGEHNSDIMRALPDMSKKDPYGGGWRTVAQERKKDQHWVLQCTYVTPNFVSF